MEIGTHVYHVCEFSLSRSEMRMRGIEGFRNWGIEVVESVIVGTYTWRLDSGITMPGWVSEVVKREVAVTAQKNFYWKESDFGKEVFLTKFEAACRAEERAKLIQMGIKEDKYSQRPLYKNWAHWKDLHRGEMEIEADRRVTAGIKKEQHHTLPARFSMDVYEEWKNGLSNTQAAIKCRMPISTFVGYAKRLMKERGEKRTQTSRGGAQRRTLPENFNDIYEEWENGNLKPGKAALACGMSYSSFMYQAKKMHQKRIAEGIISDGPQNISPEYEPGHEDDIDLGHHNYMKAKQEGAE